MGFPGIISGWILLEEFLDFRIGRISGDPLPFGRLQAAGSGGRTSGGGLFGGVARVDVPPVAPRAAALSTTAAICVWSLPSCTALPALNCLRVATGVNPSFVTRSGVLPEKQRPRNDPSADTVPTGSTVDPDDGTGDTVGEQQSRRFGSQPETCLQLISLLYLCAKLGGLCFVTVLCNTDGVLRGLHGSRSCPRAVLRGYSRPSMKTETASSAVSTTKVP